MENFIETKRAPNPKELIQEWTEWEGLPKLPDLDEKEIIKMNYKLEYQEILKEIEGSQMKLTNDQYIQILTFQSRLVLFVFKHQIDNPQLTLHLHELRVLCIWKDDQQKIIRTLNLISKFFQKIDNIILNQKEEPKHNKNSQNISIEKKLPDLTNNITNNNNNNDNYGSINDYSNKTNIKNSNNTNSRNNNTSSRNNNNTNISSNNANVKNNNNNTNKNSNNDEKYNSNDNYIKKSDNSFYSSKKKLPLNPNNSAPRSKKPINQTSENPFQSLSNSNDLYMNDGEDGNDPLFSITYISEKVFNQNNQHKQNHVDTTSPMEKQFKELMDLLNVKNGITNEKQTRTIFEKIQRLYKSHNDDTTLRDEYYYFEKRKMVPLQHLVSLSNYISKEYL